MVIIIILLNLFVALGSASASEVTQAFNQKDFRRVTESYRQNQKKNYSRQELIYISYSLRKMGYYRQDINLNVIIINKHYKRHHQKLLQSIKRGDTVDGDDYPEGLMVLYWNLLNSYGQILKGYKEDSPKVEDDHKYFVQFSKILSELEFREGKVDKYNDAIIAHRQLLKDKIYHLKKSWSVQYVSWQQEAILNHPSGSSTLIITNKGLCAGGDVGYENYRFHFYLDGCVLYGSGGVKNNDQNLVANYQQSNVPALGVKAGPGASYIVSSSKSRIGFKIPIIYSIQDLTSPKDPDYSIEQASSLSYLASLYSRWQFNKWYFQTEFGKYIQSEQAFWGLGIGKEF